MTPGWNTKYLEEFTVNTSHLVRDYADWADWRTTAAIVPTAVFNGYAQVRIGNFIQSIGGAITENGSPDVVPDQEFTTQFPERNKWTAVMDFLPVQSTVPPEAHASVFLRVLNRVWDGLEDQTRFGTFVYGGLMTADNICQNQPCGALQVTGDDVTANPPQSKGKTKLFHFRLCTPPGPAAEL